MAASTGTVVIAEAGGEFDSADYPRFVLGDGTNSLTFVIDNHASQLQTRYVGELATAYTASTQTPFEDSQRGRVVIPTFDESDGATKAGISFYFTDSANIDNALNQYGEIATAGNAGFKDIAVRPHWVIRDADGDSIKIGFGSTNATAITNQSAVLLYKYSASGSPRYWLYRETASSRNYFIRVVNEGTNAWKAHQVFFGAIKHAYTSGLINIDVQGIKSDGSLMSASLGTLGGAGSYTSSEAVGIRLEYETAGAKGNACSFNLVDAQAHLTASSAAEKIAASYGYNEYAQAPAIARHTLNATADNDQFLYNNVNTEIYFRGGTKAGSGSDASLSAADIAESIKDIINGSKLEITATRSDATVNLTNDNDSDVGNVTITTTNKGSLFSVSGMSGGGESSGVTSIMARTRIGAKLIAVGGLTKDNISSGSIEVKHLSFSDLAAADFVTDLQDADTLALSSSRGASAGMKGLTLGALKSYISSSVLTNITASGDVLIGDATGDTLNITARIISGLIPKTDGLNDLGTNALAWNTVFAESGSFSDNVGIGNNLTVSDTVSAATVSGSASTFHDLAADDLTVGGIVASSITASNGVLLGSSNADDLGFLGGQVTDLVPQNDSKVALGSATKRYSLVSAMSASIAGAVGIVGTATVGALTSAGTISGSAATVHDLTAEDVTAGGISASSITASNGVLLGSSNADDLGFLGGQITDLVPQNDNKVSLGSAAKRYSLISAMSASIAGAVGIVGTATVGALTLGGTAVTSTAAEINLLDGAAANTVVGSVAAIYGTTGQLTASVMTAGSLTASNGVILGSANTDDLSILGGLITDLVPQNDSKVDLGTSSKQFAEAHIDTGNIDTVVATAITASYAKITQLDVDTIVSRTVTKDSLEIQDNLIIAGVSGSVAGDFVGAGFQLGGKVGVSGTGSLPLMSMTLGNRKVTGDSMVINVDGQSGASFMSGGVTQAMLGTPGMRFGVTGSVSGSLLQGKRAEIGHVSVGKVSGVALVGSTSVSGATGNFHDLTGDDAVLGGLQAGSITASNGVILGSANTDDLSFLGGQITDLVPQNDNKVALGSATKRYSLVSAMSASIAGAVGIAGTATVGALSSAGGITCTGASSAISGAMGQFNRIDINRLIGKGVVTQDNLQTGSVLTAAILDANVTTAKLGAKAVTKAKLAEDVIQNNNDAHGGLVFTSGRLSVGWRKGIFVRADGSNISGTVPTHGMFATNAVATPYTTASLGAQPVSGTIMVYLNGILLHGDHHQISDAGRNIGSADYHLATGSANAYKVLLNEDLALDSDDILTITYLSGSGVVS